MWNVALFLCDSWAFCNISPFSNLKTITLNFLQPCYRKSSRTAMSRLMRHEAVFGFQIDFKFWALLWIEHSLWIYTVTTLLTRCWHVTISCQPDGRPSQPVRPWKSGRVHLADGSKVVVSELPYSTEFGRESRSLFFLDRCMVLFSFYVEVFVENACVCVRLIGPTYVVVLSIWFTVIMLLGWSSRLSMWINLSYLILSYY